MFIFFLCSPIPCFQDWQHDKKHGINTCTVPNCVLVWTLIWNYSFVVPDYTFGASYILHCQYYSRLRESVLRLSLEHRTIVFTIWSSKLKIRKRRPKICSISKWCWVIQKDSFCVTVKKSFVLLKVKFPLWFWLLLIVPGECEILVSIHVSTPCWQDRETEKVSWAEWYGAMVQSDRQFITHFYHSTYGDAYQAWLRWIKPHKRLKQYTVQQNNKSF